MDINLQNKLRKAESPGALRTLLKDNGMEITEEKAIEYFSALNRSGAIEDDELDNVSGGACYSDDGYLMVTCGYCCSHFQRSVASDSTKKRCSTCMYWDKPWGDTATEIGTWFGMPLKCVHPANRIR